jgi:fumarate reductase subunit C
MSAPRTYVRPMQGWWRRNAFYRWYMLRELTCIAVFAYGLELLTGLWRLTQGRDAFEAWRAALASPFAIAANGVVFALIAYHAWTWLAVIPKTMPFVRLGGRRVPDTLFVAGAFGAAAVASILVFVLVAGR